MLEIIIQGRCGQDAQTAANLLALAGKSPTFVA